jgi:hypothetical protein
VQLVRKKQPIAISSKIIKIMIGAIPLSMGPEILSGHIFLHPGGCIIKENWAEPRIILHLCSRIFSFSIKGQNNQTFSIGSTVQQTSKIRKTQALVRRSKVTESH